jgi:hypothetical protein
VNDYVVYTVVVGLARVLKVCQGQRHIPLPPNLPEQREDKLAVALKAIEAAENVEIREVVAKYTPGQIDETFRIITVRLGPVPQPADDPPSSAP